MYIAVGAFVASASEEISGSTPKVCQFVCSCMCINIQVTSLKLIKHTQNHCL